jgi:hypothetical protein
MARMAEISRLRAEIAELRRKRARGDVPEKAFQKQNDEKVVQLFRAIARTRMPEAEDILAEHHVIHAHTRLASSILRESDQELISLFATDRRLVEVRVTAKPDTAVTGDERDQLRVADLPFDGAVSLARRRRIRVGELAAGAAILAIGVLCRSRMGITGPALAIVGVAGLLHSLLVPTRWVEIRGHAGNACPPIRIHAVWRNSARGIIRHVRIRSSAPLAAFDQRD